MYLHFNQFSYKQMSERERERANYQNYASRIVNNYNHEIFIIMDILNAKLVRMDHFISLSPSSL